MHISSYTIHEIASLPDQPGIYKFYNEDKQLIYVGKAKNLKKRVSSYFNKSKMVDRKTKKMVLEIKSLEFTIVDSEFDALLLENNLIKKNQPKYNILLKDDKTYPFICITKERFPRVISTRKRKPLLGTYFGPYASVRAMYNVLDLVKNLFTIRTCRLDLSKEKVAAKKFKVCLEYHIGNCKGPCEGLQAEEDYLIDIEQIIHILKGNLGLARNYFMTRMQEASGEMAFEKAQAYKEKYDLLNDFQSKSMVVNPKINDVDVFGIVPGDNAAIVNYLKIKDGAIILTKTVEVKKRLNEHDEEVFPLIIIELRTRYASETKEIVTNIPLTVSLENMQHSVPQKGDKKKLVDLSVKNALFYKKEKYETQEKNKNRQFRGVQKLQEALRLQQVPYHIECFDNSNLQGSHPVASMVCFKQGKPAKKEYRHFNIRTVSGPDDFASMYEIVLRRYKRVVAEKMPLPDLIVVDGGKGQLSAAIKALKELAIYGKIPIVGIAKKLEEIYFPEDPYPLHIDKKSEALVLLQRIRDEAHRFAITFHRNKRSKQSFKTQLEGIKGVGSVTADKLLQNFKSVAKIKKASLDELALFVGLEKAKLIKNKLK